MNKIEALERRIQALRCDRQLVIVEFKDGSSRTMPLPDVIPLLEAPMVETFADVSGQPSMLLELIRTLLEGTNED